MTCSIWDVCGDKSHVTKAQFAEEHSAAGWAGHGTPDAPRPELNPLHTRGAVPASSRAMRPTSGKCRAHAHDPYDVLPKLQASRRISPERRNPQNTMTFHDMAHGDAAARAGRVVCEVIHALTTMRQQCGLTLAQLATRLAVPEITVCEWEASADHPMTMDLLRWADALDCVVRVVDKSVSTSSLTQWSTYQRGDDLELYRPLARTLQTARALADLRQQDLADKLGVSRATVSLWESADRVPRLARLIAWADTVDCRLELNAWNPTSTGGRTTTRENLISRVAALHGREPIHTLGALALRALVTSGQDALNGHL